MEKVIPLRTPLSTQLTQTQQRIWKVLQQNSNRELSIRKICTLAGYRTVTPWYDAIQDTSFRAMIEALGIVIDRQHPPMSQRVALAINTVNLRVVTPQPPWEKVLGRRLKKSECVRGETTKPICTWSRFETGDTQLVKVGIASNPAPEHQKGTRGSLPKGMFGGLWRL